MFYIPLIWLSLKLHESLKKNIHAILYNSCLEKHFAQILRNSNDLTKGHVSYGDLAKKGLII